MPFVDLSSDDLQSLVGTRHPATGIEFPPASLQPYHDWLIRTLQRLADSSVGAWRVERSGDSPTAVTIAPGRATIADVVLASPRTTLELATFNNATALVWLDDNAGQPNLAAAASDTGWPSVAHLKLAEVTLAGGAITIITDRRLDTLFRV